MGDFKNKKQDWGAHILWCIIVGSAMVVVFASVVEAFSFSFTKIAILAVSIFVALLISKYSVEIPRSGAVFLPKHVFAFWGIAGLGVFGGVLLAGAASATEHDDFRTKPGKWMAGVARDIVSIFISGLVFYLSLSYFKASQPIEIPGGFLVPNEVVFASCLMAAAHFVTSSAIDLLMHKLTAGQMDWPSFIRIGVVPYAAYLLSLASAISLFLVFNHFGIEFGLVIVPLAVAANIAYKIHTRSLDLKTKQIMEASRIHMATVEALATAIDARDQVGVGHVRRTQIYAVGMGNLLGLGEGDIDALRTGALLHDIGKLAVPDHILNKPGRLTPAEMEKTKIHSSVGASILESVGFQTPVVPTVKYHHEFWDGSGYPEGRRGSHIPLTARILTIADAFDTLRCDRPYRPAISRDDASNFLRAGAGTQFDPKIVDVFLRNLNIFEDEVVSQGLTYEFEPGIALDDSASPNYVEQIKRANREVFTLYSLAREFSSAQSLEETLSLFTQKISEFVPYESCAVYLLDETREFATAVHVDGPNGAFLKNKHVKVGEGATGYALKKRKAVENVDPALDFAFSHTEYGANFQTMVSLPLLADDKLIGAVSLYSSDLKNYQDEHFRLLETVSRIAADAISKSMQHAEAETNAMTDPMTGLPNARSLSIAFDKEVKRAERSGSSFQLLMLDLDGFKAVNDTFGHKTGDRVLKSIGEVIREQLREYDFLSRYGGDEFVILAPETDAEEIRELCRRIETAVNEMSLAVTAEMYARVGVSIGSASYPANGESFDQLVIYADKAMYLAKAFHKQGKRLPDERLDRPFAAEFQPEARAAVGETMSFSGEGENLVVELDETHIVASTSIN